MDLSNRRTPAQRMARATVPISEAAAARDRPRATKDGSGVQWIAATVLQVGGRRPRDCPPTTLLTAQVSLRARGCLPSPTRWSRWPTRSSCGRTRHP